MPLLYINSTSVKTFRSKEAQHLTGLQFERTASVYLSTGTRQALVLPARRLRASASARHREESEGYTLGSSGVLLGREKVL